MATPSSPRFLILHALRIKGIASDEHVAAMTGLATDAVVEELATLNSTGLTTRREGRMAGSMLTADGRQEHTERLADDLASSGMEPVLQESYKNFIPVNSQFKKVCSSWQLRDDTGVPNDHSDPAYDANVIKQLVETHEQLERALEAPAAALARIAVYPSRLSLALRRVRDGEIAALARPMADSYHDIWMELHQDLLLSLRHERDSADEG